MSEIKDIPETDKPFILALVSSGITILNIVFAAIGAYNGNEAMMNESIDTLKYTFTLTTMAWSYYFAKK